MADYNSSIFDAKQRERVLQCKQHLKQALAKNILLLDGAMGTNDSTV